MQRFVLFICLALASSSALAPPIKGVKKIVGAVLGRAQAMMQEVATKGEGLSAAEEELRRVLLSKVINGNAGNISNNSAMMFVSKEGDTITNLLKNKNKLTPLNLQDELALHLADKPDGAGLFIAQYSPNQYGLHGVTVSNGEIKLGKSDLFEVNIPKGDEDAIATPASLLDVLVPNKERLKLKESGKLGDVAYQRLFSFFAQGLHKDEVVALNTDEITALALKTLGYFPPEVRQAFDAVAAGVGQASDEVTEAANLFKSNFPKNGSPSPKQAQATYESAVTKAPTPEAPVEAKPQAVAKTEVQKPAADEFAKFLNRMIKKSRFENHISLAQDVNLDQSTLGRHIHGYNIPTPRSMDKITEALARDANVDAAEINTLNELWAAAKRAKDNIEPKTKLTEAQREEKEKARDGFANFFGAKVKDGHYTFSRLDEELGVETTKFAKDRLPSLKTMLKLLQPDDNLATKLKFTETELDEFVDLWKRGKPQQGFTKEGQIELDGLVARTKERIRSADAQSAKPEPQAPDASQIAETADEARHVEAQETTPLKHGELIDAAEEARVKFATHFGSIFKKSSFDSLASLAQDAGLTPTTVGNFIKGVHLPTPRSMNKITESLASDAKVDANEIKKLIKLFDAAMTFPPKVSSFS